MALFNRQIVTWILAMTTIVGIGTIYIVDSNTWSSVLFVCMSIVWYVHSSSMQNKLRSLIQQQLENDSVDYLEGPKKQISPTPYWARS